MATDELIRELMTALEVEGVLLDRYKREQEELRTQIRRKSWEDVRRILERIELLATEVNRIEDRRHHHYTELSKCYHLSEEDSFYKFASRVPGEFKGAMIRHFRIIKQLVAQIRSEAIALDVYIKSMGEVISRVLGEFYPHRRGRIYTRGGTSEEVTPNPVVLNRSL